VSARKTLSRLEIVRSALDLLDEVGIDGLTVRALAKRLGVQAPTLYWHVKNKQELLDEMGTEFWRQIASELDRIDPDISWSEAMREFARITRRKFLEHRDGAKVFSGTYLTDSAILERQESAIRKMIEQGFSVADTVRVYSLLYAFTVGYCIEEQAVIQSHAEGDRRYSIRSRDARVDNRAHPLVPAVSREIYRNSDGRFEEIVGLVVDAASRLRAG
jgi:AcrR family transcriptional regulator